MKIKLILKEQEYLSDDIIIDCDLNTDDIKLIVRNNYVVSNIEIMPENNHNNIKKYKVLDKLYLTDDYTLKVGDITHGIKYRDGDFEWVDCIDRQYIVTNKDDRSFKVICFEKLKEREVR
jgi:hypothetical protein